MDFSSDLDLNIIKTKEYNGVYDEPKVLINANKFILQ